MNLLQALRHALRGDIPPPSPQDILPYDSFDVCPRCHSTGDKVGVEMWDTRAGLFPESGRPRVLRHQRSRCRECYAASATRVWESEPWPSEHS